MNKNIFVVTYPENGWDCVGGVYRANSEEDVYKFIAEERDVDIHDENLRNTVMVHNAYYITEL